MKKAFAAIVLLLLCACRAPEPVTKTGFLLDTVITITAYDSRDHSILEDAFELCAEYDRMFSRTNPESEVWKLNNSGGAPVQVSEEVLAVLERAAYYSELTGGKYDITICPVVDLWDFNSDAPALPALADVRRALARVGWRSVIIEEGAVRLENGAQIDLGSIAKGYIADRLADFLRSGGVNSAIINLGGNVVTVGEKPSGEPFRIGIQKPFERQNKTIGTVETVNRSVVSSGVYERSFWLDGKLYHHILDPDAGYPAETGLNAVTIISERSIDGDALSTCCFLLGLEEGMALVEGLDGVDAVFIGDDGTEYFSSGFDTDLKFTPAA